MISSYEKRVIALLNSSSIPFIKEKTFSDCRNGLYRFDFYLPSLNILIEVNGAQHYEYTKTFFKNRADFTKAQERDRCKISYALAHFIPIYCIPYWEINNLTDASQLFNKKFLAHSKFHNDDVWNAKKNEKK